MWSGESSLIHINGIRIDDERVVAKGACTVVVDVDERRASRRDESSASRLHCRTGRSGGCVSCIILRSVGRYVHPDHTMYCSLDYVSH